jgi:hypothetical protein
MTIDPSKVCSHGYLNCTDAHEEPKPSMTCATCGDPLLGPTMPVRWRGMIFCAEQCALHASHERARARKAARCLFCRATHAEIGAQTHELGFGHRYCFKRGWYESHVFEYRQKVTLLWREAMQDAERFEGVTGQPFVVSIGRGQKHVRFHCIGELPANVIAACATLLRARWPDAYDVEVTARVTIPLVDKVTRV